MTTSSADDVQIPFVIVHLNVTDEPTTNPVIVVVGEFTDVIVAVPDITLQVPVPTVGASAAIVAVVILHKSWSAPALAVLGGLRILITTSLNDVHEPLEVVHLKVADEPIANPVNPDVGDVGVVIVAVPETKVHTPVPVVGVFPASVAVVILHNV